MEGQIRSDAELVTRFIQSRDDEAFAEIVKRHASMVKSVSYRITGNLHDAEDVAQAVFIVLFRKASTLKNRENMSSWLHGISKNISYQIVNRRAKNTLREENYSMSAESTATCSPDSTRDQELVMQIIDSELALLTEKQRQAVILRYLEGWSQEGAAAIAGCSVSAFGVRASDGINCLRQRLAKRGSFLGVTAIASVLACRSEASVSLEFLQKIILAAKAAGTGVPGAAVSGTVIELANGGMKMLMMGKLKLLAAYAAVAVLILGTAIILGMNLLADGNAGKDKTVQINEKNPVIAQTPDTGVKTGQKSKSKSGSANQAPVLPKALAYGEPVNGLAIAVSVVTADAKLDKPVNLRVTRKNVGKETIEIYAGCLDLVPLTDQGNAVQFQKAGGMFVSLPAPGANEKPCYTLKPGSELVTDYNLGRYDNRDMVSYMLMTPGAYRVKAVFKSTGSYLGHKGWNGEISALSDTFEVGGFDASRITFGPEVNGLKFRITPIVDTYYSGDTPRFRIEASSRLDHDVVLVIERRELLVEVKDPDGKVETIPANKGDTLFAVSGNVPEQGVYAELITFPFKFANPGRYEIKANVEVGASPIARQDRWQGKGSTCIVGIEIGEHEIPAQDVQKPVSDSAPDSEAVEIDGELLIKAMLGGKSQDVVNAMAKQLPLSYDPLFAHLKLQENELEKLKELLTEKQLAPPGDFSDSNKEDFDQKAREILGADFEVFQEYEKLLAQWKLICRVNGNLGKFDKVDFSSGREIALAMSDELELYNDESEKNTQKSAANKGERLAELHKRYLERAGAILNEKQLEALKEILEFDLNSAKGEVKFKL